MTVRFCPRAQKRVCELLCSRARLGGVRDRIEDLASILWSGANRKSARCTETVSFDKRTRGLSESTKIVLGLGLKCPSS